MTSGERKPTASLILCIIGGLFILVEGLVGLAFGSIQSNTNSSGTGTVIVNGHIANASNYCNSFVCMNGAGASSNLIIAAGIICGIIVLASGVMVFVSAPARMGRVRFFGALAVVFSLISMIGGGGGILGLVLGLIGGILALTYKQQV